MLLVKINQYLCRYAAQHVAKIENLANQLKDIGENVSDIMILTNIIGTLPWKYSAFILAWDSVAKTDQTLSKLRKRILRKELRLANTDDMTSALTATNISKHQDKKDSY